MFPASKSSPSHSLAHCFCLFLFHQWWWSTLQLHGSVFHRFNFTQVHLHSGFNSVLCIHQNIISLLSFALVQEQWCPSGQLFWTAHDARDLDSEGKQWWMPVVKTYFSVSFQTQRKIWSEGLLLCSSISALGCCNCSEESIPFSAWIKLLKGIAAFSEYFSCSIYLWGNTLLNFNPFPVVILTCPASTVLKSIQ